MQPDLMYRFRLTDQFEVDFIGDDPRADEEAIELLQMKGCEFFRKTSWYDKDTGRKVNVMTGWIGVEATDEPVSATMDKWDIFYRPASDSGSTNASETTS